MKLLKKKTTKKYSIPENEDQSFTEIFAMYDKQKLDLRKMMDYYVTSRPYAIVNEDEKSRNNNKHLFRNHLQNLSPIPETHNVPDNISTSIVDAMRAIRMISVAGLKLRTFKSWADEIMNYLSSMPGTLFLTITAMSTLIRPNRETSVRWRVLLTV